MLRAVEKDALLSGERPPRRHIEITIPPLSVLIRELAAWSFCLNHENRPARLIFIAEHYVRDFGATRLVPLLLPRIAPPCPIDVTVWDTPQIKQVPDPSDIGKQSPNVKEN